MAENEKQSIQRMADALEGLPEEKKQFFLGYAEGVAAMVDPSENKST